jgi:thioester reductase-like protein
MNDFKKDALLAIETLQARVRELEQSDRQDMAIIGYAARLPGARDAEAFWSLLHEGRDAVSPIPPDRWDADAFYDADPDAPGKMFTRRAGFLDDVVGFDAQFFGVSPREAMYMDPQHRLMLETAWHALEHACLAPADLAGTRAGVFMGLSTHDYLGLLSSRLKYEAIEAYFGTGTSPAAGAGRISYRLGLEGPAVTVDTACSSSLVAIHQACQSLRVGECDLALVGGVNVILTPATMINFSRARMLAPDGRCKTFDAAADGYVRGEGCGVVVLKRLADAQRDGDRIRAVIRGSAVNQDGASGGLTVPNGRAQQRVIQDALQQAGLAPGDVDYLEAHGTGTPLGDPIEVQAAAAVLGTGRSPDRPLWLGSVKTNIGHLEAAAGIAGVIKVVLALEHATLPRHLHFTTPSPHIPWDRLPVRVVRQTQPWPRTRARRTAGISSFGFSGTNAHVLIEEAPPLPASPPVTEPPEKDPTSVGRQEFLLPLSARTPEALRALASRYAAWLAAHPEADLAAVCDTAGRGRSHLEHRAALVVDRPDRAREGLAAIADEQPLPGVFTGVSHDPPKTAWLFTGQGSQYAGMGRALYETQPVVRQTLDACDAVLRDVLERPLLEVLFGDEARLAHTSYAQPALFALEMALARLWQAWGLEPDVLVGHSVGQYTAACVAGVFSLEDGLRLLAERGRLFGALPPGGRMAALFADARQVDERVAQTPDVSVAAYNGAHTVVSGPGPAVEAVVAPFQAQGIRCEWLDTSHAFHSVLLDPALDAFEHAAAPVAVQPPARTLICNRTGKVLTGQAVLDARYWRKHARQPVQFAESVQTLSHLGCTVLLELGPQPILSATALRAWPEAREAPRAIASLRREVPDTRQILEALAQLYVAGSRPDFRALAGPHRTVDLPTYPFQHRYFWFEQKHSNNAPTGPGEESTATSEVVRLLEEEKLDELARRLDGQEDTDLVVRVLQNLAAHHRSERHSRLAAEHLYEVSWERVSSPPPVLAFNEGQHWVIITRDAHPHQPISDLLQAQGQRVTTVALPSAGVSHDEMVADLERALDREPPALVLLLAALDLPGELSAESLAAMQDEVLAGTLDVLQAALKANLRAPIWIVTRGAQSIVDGDAVSPPQTCLWGLGRVLALEHPELWGGLVDLPPTGVSDWQQLITLLRDRTRNEDQLAIRGEELYVARLRRRPTTRVSAPLPVRTDATYLITGGLGALGLETAQHLAAQGATTLVLTSRRSPDEHTRHRIDRIRDRHGCQLHVVSADISLESDVERVIAFIRDSLPPLAGIVHAAGEIAASPMRALTRAEVQRVFSGKVWGALRLSEAISGLPLDFFIGFSSIASVWGSFGQAAYAAANAFLDGLACLHRHHGIRGTSINFGPWSAGMANEEAREQLARRGVHPMAADMALAGMNAIAGTTAAHGIVARIDWATFLPVYQLQARRPLMEELERECPEGAPTPSPERTSLVERLIQAPAEQRRTLLQDHLRHAVAQTMRLEPSQVRDDAGFFDLGMDSLMAIELRKRLEKDLGRSLPATMAIDYPRLTDAAEYLLAEVLGLQEISRIATPGRTAASVDEPIAIVGLACRFPGAPGREAFWELLSKGVDAVREVPGDRYDINEYYDPDPEARGKIYTRYGGFLDQVDLFDAELFGISPREALWIDPQQRLMLETAWEGLEDAGYAPASLARSRTGIFVGVGANEYSHLLATGSPEGIDAYFITGNALNVIAGRVAFALAFEGPAITVDTACSSSLVAVHQASQALRAGECDLALAGGVNVLLSPASTIATCRARMLAPDGRCKTFDAAADGYVRGEGCGVVVLKRLADAQRDGDHIRAVIRGSAVNQDGASGGLTVPNGRAQQRVIQDALQQAGLAPADVNYLEAHGTGTSLGDPIEVQAAAAVLGTGRSPERPLWLGSVKTNIGHLEAAAGIAGVIKVVLALEHATLPRHLHFTTPSPHIPWDQLPVRVVRETQPWPRAGARRTAGISAFGFSGTNAHVLIEEAPVPATVSSATDLDDLREHESEPSDTPREFLLPLSARTPEALRALASRYAAWLAAHPEADLAAVCDTAGRGRSHLEHRAALVVDRPDRAREGLAAIADEQPLPGVFTGVSHDPPKTAWLFTGQGSQYAGMGRALYETQPVVRQTLDACDAVLRDVLERPLLEVLFGDEARLAHTSYAQPALFALEMALARLWQAWGLEPDVLVGHSVGQYTAACVAGVFSLEDGLRLLAERGRLFGALPPGGRMAALFADARQVDERVAQTPDVSVAAYNGAHTVVSGPGPAVEAVAAPFQAQGIRCEWLDTSHAFHSVLLDPALDAFEHAAAQVAVQPPARTLICNRTGKVLTGQAVLDARYWRKHARQPVQFAESVQTLSHLGCTVLLELGPQPILSATALRAWPEAREAPRAIASLRREVPDTRQILEALAQLYVAGSRPDFRALAGPHRTVDLPTYPFQRRRFWPRTDGLRPGESQAHGLLGSRRDLASGDTVYSTRFSVRHQPWLADHVIYGTVVVPGATYAAMALLASGVPGELREVFFYEPMLFSDTESRDVQVTLHAPDETAPGRRAFEVHSRPFEDKNAQWSLNSGGSIVSAHADAQASDEPESIEAILERLSPLRPQQLFDGFADNELRWGPTWCTSLTALWSGHREAVGEIAAGEELAAHLGGEPIHPVLLDLCTGVAGASLLAAQPAADDDISLFLPLKYERVDLHEQIPRHFFCRVKWQTAERTDTETQAFDVDLIAPDGRRLGGIRNFIVKRAPRQALLRGLGVDSSRLLYRVAWRELPVTTPSPEAVTPGVWLAVSARSEALEAARQQLLLRKQSVIRIQLDDGWKTLAADRIALDPRRTEHWQAALALAAQHGTPLAGIVWQIAAGGGTSPHDDPLAGLEDDISGLLEVVRHLLRKDASPLPRGLWIVTERAVAVEPSEKVHPGQSAFWGLGRVVATEQPTVRCTLVDHDASADWASLLADLLMTSIGEPELALRQRKCLVPRLMPWSRAGQLAVPGTQDFRLEPAQRGAIDQLQLSPATVSAPEPGYVQVRVQAAGLNFRDVLNALDLYPGDPGPLGGELAGIVTAVGEGVEEFQVGQRVFGFCPGAFASRVNVPYVFLAPQPDRLRAVEAATTPAAMLTAGLAFEWARPQPGERVLIHAASGGVGLAAVQLAKRCGAIVFATASKPKQHILRELGVEHVYDSRSTAFADQILADTEGAGVDVVLNSLTNEGFVEATVRATAARGRFVEIAKLNIWSADQMAAARPDISYEILALDDTMRRDPLRIRQLLIDLAGSLARREVDALPSQVYPITEAKAAFRCMQQARHIGKIVLQVPEALKPRADRSYLITGGLGALGLRTAAYLAQMGAGHLILTSRKPPDDALELTIGQISSQFGCSIHVMTGDVGQEDDIRRVLTRIRQELPPLAGVAHLAGVLDDGLLPQQSWDRFRAVMAPKAHGAWHLHRLTEEEDLDFFLLYSSASSVLGSPGQANYAVANAFLDGLAAHRHARGRAATSVNFGPWADAGMAAGEVARAHLAKQGLISLKPAAALAAVSEIASHGIAQAMVIHADWQRMARLFGAMRPPMLEHVLPKVAATRTGEHALLRQLHQVPAAQRADFITEHLQRELQHILGLAQPPAPESRFLELGMDSLMAVELRNRLLGQFGSAFTISSTVVFEYPSIRALSEYLATQAPASAAPEPVPVITPEPEPATDDVPTIDGLRATVAELAEKLAPFRELGIRMHLDGLEDESRTDVALLEEAILRQESDAACREVMRDAVLADDVRPGVLEGPRSTPHRALLTGATGFVGGFLLRELLRANTRVTCLVRCQNANDGMARVAANLQEMQISAPELTDLVEILPANIAQPCFGLPPEHYAAVAERVDRVFHCAASTGFWFPYSRLRDANVEGTRRVVEFTCFGSPKVLHLMSSTAVFLSTRYSRRSGVLESEFPDTPWGNMLGYGQSKWAAESLVRQAQARGTRAVIYRPGAILGDTEHGYWSPRDLLTRFTAHSLATTATGDIGRMLEGVPVDVMARFIHACANDPVAWDQTFHLIHPTAIGVQDWSDILVRHGMAAFFSYEQWMEQYMVGENSELHQPLFEQRGTGVNATIMECFRDLPTFDASGFHRHLAAYGIECPDYDAMVKDGWLDGLRATSGTVQAVPTAWPLGT